MTLILAWAEKSSAQVVSSDDAKGSLQGQVRERVSQQANVVVAGTKLGASTALDGRFRIDGVAEDVYSVSVTFIGYEQRILAEIRVVRGKVTVIPDIELSDALVVGDEIVVTSSFFENEKRAPVSTYKLYSRRNLEVTGCCGRCVSRARDIARCEQRGWRIPKFFCPRRKPERQRHLDRQHSL